jgi:hypothetical protein
MGRKKKSPRPQTRFDRIVGIICGILAGAMLSFFAVAVFSETLPYPGVFGIVVSTLPGIPVGALLGWFYPRPFTMIGDGIFSGL